MPLPPRCHAAGLSTVGRWDGWGETWVPVARSLPRSPPPASFLTAGAKGKKLGQAVKPPVVSWTELLPPPPSASELSRCTQEEEEEEEEDEEEEAASG